GEQLALRREVQRSVVGFVRESARRFQVGRVKHEARLHLRRPTRALSYQVDRMPLGRNEGVTEGQRRERDRTENGALAAAVRAEDDVPAGVTAVTGREPQSHVLEALDVLQSDLLQIHG